MTMNLPGYDDWKTHNPADDCCEYCGADPRYCRGGWHEMADAMLLARSTPPAKGE